MRNLLRASALLAFLIVASGFGKCPRRVEDDQRQKPEPEKRPCVFVSDPPVKRCY